MRTPSRPDHAIDSSSPVPSSPCASTAKTRVIKRGLARAMFIFVDADDFAGWDDFAAA
jgi:hypothetical protein